MPRILILHATVGSGHKSAAAALAAAFERLPDSEVKVDDALDYANQIFRNAYTRSYLELSQKAPLIWQMVYETTDADESEWTPLWSRLRGLAAELTLTNLKRMIRRFKPSAIVCTHFLPAELMMRLKLDGELRVPTYTVITDHAVHSQWIVPGVDGYFVASEFPRDLMVARGVTPAIIRVTGIPVNPEIATPKDSAEVRARHGLPAEGAVVSLFGGGLSVARVRRIVLGLVRIEQPGTLVVVAGRNAELPRALAGIRGGPRMDLRVLGQIDFVDDLVAASDLVITKSGGLIVSEVLARGAPLVVVDPIPGQEEWNADYLISSGAGVQLRLPDWVPWTVAQLLADRERMAILRDHARRAGRPNAARDIAECVANDLRANRIL